MTKEFQEVKLWRQIYISAFEYRGSSDALLAEIQNRLCAAENVYRREQRSDEIEECAACGVEGITEDDERDGDDMVWEILRKQIDWCSMYYNSWLCDECITADENRLAGRE